MMIDGFMETPDMSRRYCPGCEPDADPIGEILQVQWCAIHSPSQAGLDDAGVTSTAFLSGNAEAGGEENARWCAFIRGELQG